MERALRELHQKLGAGTDSFVIHVRLCAHLKAAERQVRHDTKFYVCHQLYGDHAVDLRPRFVVSAKHDGEIFVQHGFIAVRQSETHMAFQQTPPTGRLDEMVHSSYTLYSETMAVPELTVDEIQSTLRSRYQHFLRPQHFSPPALQTRKQVQLDFFVAVTLARHLNLVLTKEELAVVEAWLLPLETRLAVDRALRTDQVKFGGGILEGVVHGITADKKTYLRNYNIVQSFVALAPFEKVLGMLPGRPVMRKGWVYLTQEHLRQFILPNRVKQLVSPASLRQRFGAHCPFFRSHTYLSGLFATVINSIKKASLGEQGDTRVDIPRLPPCMGQVMSGNLRIWPKFEQRRLLGQVGRRLGIRPEELTRAIAKSGAPSKSQLLGAQSYFRSQAKYAKVGPGPSCLSFVCQGLCPLAKSCKGDPVIVCRKIRRVPPEVKMHPAEVARAHPNNFVRHD